MRRIVCGAGSGASEGSESVPIVAREYAVSLPLQGLRAVELLGNGGEASTSDSAVLVEDCPMDGSAAAESEAVGEGSSSTAAAVDANAATTSRHGEALIEAMGRVTSAEGKLLSADAAVEAQVRSMMG